MLATGDYSCYEYFVENTRHFGDYDAAEHFGKRITRSEFLADIDGLAAFFSKEYKLKRGDVFTVFLPTCVQSFVLFYALNKIGIIVNFVHPLTPPELLRETMQQSKSKGIAVMDILVKDYVAVINQQKVPCLVCSNSDYTANLRKAPVRLFEAVAHRPIDRLHQKTFYRKVLRLHMPGSVQPHNGHAIAVYLNGGGTTGKSKTIKLTSKAINELVYKISEIGDPRDPGSEATILVLPLFHAFGLCVGLHLSACYGFRLLPMMRFKAKKFNALMQRNRIVFIVGIPGMFKKLMREENFAGPHLRHLRLLFCGGDDVSEAVLDEFNHHLDRWNAETHLMRGYGLTEVSSVCSVNTSKALRRESIGRPLTGMRMEIWDDTHKQMPNGEIGEIVVTGETLMEGYFVPGKPEDEGLYTDDDGVKWVLTGDLGYQDDDGFFYFSGRKKRLIMISGYNVYPADIENRVTELSFVNEACAVQGYLEGKPIVKLYVVLEKGAQEEKCKEEIFEFCARELPRFSLPRKVVVLDELPRTQMSKVDFMRLTDQFPQAD